MFTQICCCLWVMFIDITTVFSKVILVMLLIENYMNCIKDKEIALIWNLKKLKIYTDFMERMMGKTLLPTPHPTCEDKIHSLQCHPTNTLFFNCCCIT